MTQIARDLRTRETTTEDRLWSVLRDRRLAGLKFRRQHPIAGTAYVVDFLCYAAMLVVEVDGGIHDVQEADDRIRQEVIEALGYHVIRFRNEDVLRNLQGVLVSILMAVREANESLLGDEALTPNPSPSGRGGPEPRGAHLDRPATPSQKTHNQAIQNSTKHAPNTDSHSTGHSGSPLPEGEGLGVRAYGQPQQDPSDDSIPNPLASHSAGLAGSPLPEGEGLGVRADTDTAS